ncbi:MAG: hypothetical protein U5K38_16510 [Woeseiaceae bacterium]|nr:hypothetical protein [Woeseiaceae bacterium]
MTTVLHAGVPLAFAVADPARNALPAATLLAGFCLTATGFLAFAIIAAKRGLETETHGRKSFFYSTGLVEGTETIMFFVLMMLMPAWFPYIAGPVRGTLRCNSRSAHVAGDVGIPVADG